MLRKEYIYFTDDGHRYSRELCMEVLEHQTAFELMELEPIKVNIHGDNATASYVATGDGTLGGRPVRGMFKIEQRMIRENENWQIAETHTKIIAPLY